MESVSELYTSSRLRVLRACLQLHYFRYVLGITSTSTDAMRFGTVGHAAIEAWLRAWKAGQLATRLNNALQAINASELQPTEKAKLRALLVAYDLRWGSEDWEIIDVEIEFRYQLDSYLIGGKCDALIKERATGRKFVLEHKFTSQDAAPGSAYWERLIIDTQVSIYIDGATMLGHEIAGCIYDVIQRPRHEIRLATPAEERKYTKGTPCKLCKQTGLSSVTADGKCAACKGSTWKLDEHGEPQAPHIYANQRDADETLEEYEIRILEAIAADPDAFLIRGNVVRLDDEIPRMRNDLIDAIKLERAAAVFDLHPRNPDNCAKYGQLCSMFAICSGAASVDDIQRFPRSGAHPELATAA